MNKKKNILLIVDFVLMLVFVVLDQFTKYLAVYYLKEMPPIELIKGVFELNYWKIEEQLLDCCRIRKYFLC